MAGVMVTEELARRVSYSVGLPVKASGHILATLYKGCEQVVIQSARGAGLLTTGARFLVSSGLNVPGQVFQSDSTRRQGPWQDVPVDAQHPLLVGFSTSPRSRRARKQAVHLAKPLRATRTQLVSSSCSLMPDPTLMNNSSQADTAVFSTGSSQVLQHAAFEVPSFSWGDSLALQISML